MSALILSVGLPGRRWAKARKTWLARGIHEDKRWDSNSRPLRDQILSPARLPFRHSPFARDIGHLASIPQLPKWVDIRV